MPPPTWKKPIELDLLWRVYQSAKAIMYSTPLRIVVTFRMSPAMQWAA